MKKRILLLLVTLVFLTLAACGKKAEIRSRTAYREKFRWKDNQDTCGCRWTWQSSVYRLDSGSGSSQQEGY